MGKYKMITLLDDVDATTSSAAAGVLPGRRVGFYLRSKNITSGNGVFRFQGTVDGIDWVYLNPIDNLSNSNTQTLTRVATKQLSTNGRALLWLDEALPLRAVRAHVTFATDGSYYCAALIAD